MQCSECQYVVKGKGEEFVWADYENMAILESCCGSGLAVSSAVLGVYLLIAYIIGFAIELWWILESPATPPIPAYLLCLGYFVLLVFSVLLLHGLSAKRTSLLLIWLFMMGILLGPEAGLVLYLSIHYWRVTSLHGLIEVTCWACRLVVNATGLLCVQSLHSIWREEKSVLLRLETLKKSPGSKTEGRVVDISSVSYGYKDDGYEVKAKNDAESFFGPSHCEAIVKDGDYECSYGDASLLSEFNASSFDRAIINSSVENMPYLTIRKKLTRSVGICSDEGGTIPKARSLIDFRDIEESAEVLFRVESEKRKPASRSPLEKGSNPQIKSDSTTDSLESKIIKNKNLKILKTPSPFNSKKPMKLNIYRINPPNQHSSNLDNKLNEIYISRGMYTFDQKLKKVVYYPPEFFSNSIKFRKRMDSYGSSQSRSSVDTDSDDIRHISDVAL